MIEVTVQVGWFGGAVSLQEVLEFRGGRRPPQPPLVNVPLNGYMIEYSNKTSSRKD